MNKKIEKNDVLSKILSGGSFTVDVFQREYDPTSTGLTVKKGSLISADVHTDGKFRSANSVLKYREQYCDGTTVKKDVVFKSASTAAI